MKAAFVLDPSRCTGCEACRVACCIENQVPMERSWRTIHHVNAAHLPAQPTFHLSMACNHCDHPACLEGCPAQAYRRDEATGAVLIDDAVCIGCQYCAWVCPYGAPQFDAARGVMTKCTFCQHRLAEDRAPACAASCPTGALGVMPRGENPPDVRLPGFTETGLGPALRLVPGGTGSVPGMAQIATDEDLGWLQPPAVAPAGLRQHWTLLLFTYIAILLVSTFAAWFLGAPSLVPAWAFALLGAVAGGLSTLHLGRPERAWRAVRNLRSSWLSREVFAFGAFLPAATLCLWFDLRGPVAAATLAVGALLMVAMDRLYQVAEGRPWGEADPAGALLTAIYFAGFFAQLYPLAGAVAIVKLALMLGARRERLGGLFPYLRLAGPLLVLLSVIFPWMRGNALLIGVLAAELAGRADFYQRLSFVGSRPRAQAGTQIS